MSNLPPGVTGNEWQIAGAECEWDEVVECNQPGISVRTISKYGESLLTDAIERLVTAQRSLGDGELGATIAGTNITLATGRIRSALSEIELAETETPCPFVGPVTIQRYGGMDQWECPLCRHQHEIEVED